MPALKVIATPIGNIEEVSPRVKAALTKCEVLFCEDTRVTKKLLGLLGIDFSNKQFIINNEFKEKQNSSTVANLIHQYHCGLVSDAGYPSVSDPGHILVEYVRTQLPQIAIEVINGPSALVCGLVTSGFPESPLLFLGFLDHKPTQVTQTLKHYQNFQGTIVLFEAVHRLQQTLEVIQTVFSNTEVFVGRELTKLHESHYWFNTSAPLPDITLKGEFVIVINNHHTQPVGQYSDQLLKQEITQLVQMGVKVKDACHYLAKRLQLKSNKLYTLFHESD